MSGPRVLVVMLACVAVVLAAPWVGAPMDDGARDFILTQIRIPRVCMGALVGAVLGVTGAAYQTIFQNPLATPSTVGTSAGATLGALSVLVLSPGGEVVGLPVLVVAAFAESGSAPLPPQNGTQPVKLVVRTVERKGPKPFPAFAESSNNAWTTPL